MNMSITESNYRSRIMILRDTKIQFSWSTWTQTMKREKCSAGIWEHNMMLQDTRANNYLKFAMSTRKWKWPFTAMNLILMRPVEKNMGAQHHSKHEVDDDRLTDHNIRIHNNPVNCKLQYTISYSAKENLKTWSHAICSEANRRRKTHLVNHYHYHSPA